MMIFISLNKEPLSSKRLHKNDHSEGLIWISIANTPLEKSPRLSGILSVLLATEETKQVCSDFRVRH